MIKYIFAIIIILLNFYTYAGENKCSKCYKSCINKPNYNILDSEEVIKFLKEGKISIIKDQDNILKNADKSFLKTNLFYKEGSYYVNQNLTFILTCKCCDDCLKKEC
ncbi:hypothetical protein [Silvanigrella sp.]|uniref:hypothetical protein n=1 Tax=Silvanigrella sp. TaxID=2024976 RepID=UPI0037CA215D